MINAAKKLNNIYKLEIKNNFECHFTAVMEC